LSNIDLQRLLLLLLLYSFFSVLFMWNVFLSNYIIDVDLLWCWKTFKANVYIIYFKVGTSSSNLHWCTFFSLTIKFLCHFIKHLCISVFFYVQTFYLIFSESSKLKSNNRFKTIEIIILITIIFYASLPNSHKN